MIASCLMRAIVVREFGGPDVMRVEERPTPKPGPGEVLVRVHAAGVNPVDAYIRSGTYARKPTLPYVPGSDGAGEVESGRRRRHRLQARRSRLHRGRQRDALGAGHVCRVRDLRADAAASAAADASRSARARRSACPYATAYRALFYRANARPGETVLVHGATGGVGIAAVQIGKMHGMRVLATGGTERGLERRARARRRRGLQSSRRRTTSQAMSGRDRRARRRHRPGDGRAHQPRQGSRRCSRATAASSSSATAAASRSIRGRRWRATPRSSG